MWADTQYLVCGTSLTLLDVNCNTLSVTSEIFNALDDFQLSGAVSAAPKCWTPPARTCRALPISAMETIPKEGEESSPKYSFVEGC